MAFGQPEAPRKRYPPVPPSTFKILAGFAVVHSMIIGVCCLVIVLPIVYSRSKRRKYFWIWKRVYISHVTTPLWVVNSVMIVAMAQLVSSIVCLLYTYLDYASFTSPAVARKINLQVLAQIMWLFGFYEYWTTTCSGLCTVLCSPLRRIPAPLRPLVNHPQLVNYFNLSVPIMMTTATIAWQVSLSLAHQNESKMYLVLRERLISDGKQLDNKETIQFKLLFEILREYIHVNQKLVSLLRGNSYFWFSTGLITLTTKIQQPGCDSEQPGSDSEQPGSDSERNWKPDKVAASLRQGYIYMLCHFSVMAFSITYTIVVCLLVAIQARQVVDDSTWRSLGSWLYLVSGVIVAFALLLQSWRICTDLDIIISESAHTSDQTDCTRSLSDELESHYMDDVVIQGAHKTEASAPVEIQRAQVGVRYQKAQVLVIRKAF
ncbi:uncharacterized protein MELLADRAFT_115912 [Melampsora larici-populina 98AG31]|uniref:Uncharacterized protein n=1 Tax=Melampsora larici-populina (strain 98AG31 / pathotype 3-4-7) TaxID=747676 RepID=F4RFM7_MELLP|nr:uncharacterized protein MELLADRAFT_115912 [Melampsora larici-populina 98AG31]EGG08837.1 hypothetical protein MELLADRAFT_115912 [Melampsora larici-populina 98AG31]